MNGLTPHGTYTVAVMLEDAAGNWAMADAGRKHMNERGPNVDLNQWALPLVISQSLTLSGTASILPEWGSGVVEHHFEEPAGATQFYNTANSQFYTLTHSICTACLRPGRSAYLILASSSMAWMMQLRFPMSLRQR